MKNHLENISILTVRSPAELAAAREIREEVFVREQGIPRELENDGLDKDAEHLLVFYNHLPAATGRMLAVSEEEANLARIAVLAPYRGLGLGKLVIKELEKLARKSGIKRVFIFPHFYLEGFYASLGYRNTPEVRQVGHHRLIKMTKELA